MSSRRWTFTINNPDPETESPDAIETACRAGKSYKYLVFQLETGENGTPHYQGFVIFDGVRRLSAVKSINARAHWEPAHGSSTQNRHYCTKPVPDCHCTHCNNIPPPLSGPFTYGECPESAGARSDLILLRDSLVSGKRKRDIIQDNDLLPAYAKYMRFADRVQSLIPPPRPIPPELTLLYGPAGCGKTRHVYDSEDDLWTRPVDDHLWFDGYDNHQAALLDDFSGKFSKTSLPLLLRIIDRYPVQLPIKGAHVWFTPLRIYITTNIHPRDWYEWTGREAQYASLYRRFTSIVSWRADSSSSRQYHRGDEGFNRFFTSYHSHTSYLDAPRIGVTVTPVDQYDFHFI